MDFHDLWILYLKNLKITIIKLTIIKLKSIRSLWCDDN